MVNEKGQGALEYLMTYGWAILVVIIVGIVLWQSGVFNVGTEAVSGFNEVRVEDFSFSVSNGLSVVWRNAAGQTLKRVSVIYTSVDLAKSPQTDATFDGESGDNWSSGREYLTSNSSETCSGIDIGYTIDIEINYTSETGLSHTESGSIRGTCEA